jgi:hypothetical protein
MPNLLQVYNQMLPHYLWPGQRVADWRRKIKTANEDKSEGCRE